MRVIRYDRDYSRRHFLKGLAGGCAAAGVLAPLWSVIAESGESTAAYPDELRSIEDYTRGRIMTGDEITADNVELDHEARPMGIPGSDAAQ
jgi:TAT (twin-arginine translocation) pathway signal sequence